MNTTDARPKAPTLTIANDLAYLPMAVQFAVQNAALIGFTKAQISQIELSVEEAVSNVIKHAFKPEENAEFQIICERVPLGLKTIIKDKGLPWDPQATPDYRPENLQEENQESGLGWYLMQQFMDEVAFHNLGRDGKEVHLTKYLQQEAAERPPGTRTGDAGLEVPKTALAPGSIDFSVRKATPSDAIEIAKCAYDVYHYDYVFGHIYYPDRFSGFIQSGEIISVIAVTKDKQKIVMAHNALVLDPPDERTAEMGMTLTRDSFQNQGCGKKLGLLLVKEAVKKGLIGIWGTAVTTHIYSQKGVTNSGARECGIFLGRYTQAFQWQRLNPNTQRVSAVLSYFAVPLTSTFRIVRQKKIYVPAQHREIAEDIYANLKQKPRFAQSENPRLRLPDSPSVLSVDVTAYDRRAKIKVESFGADIIEQIRIAVKQLCIDKLDVIYLFLKLTDPLTALLTERFESMGFFFSGILPGPVSGDKLILQYLNNVQIDYDEVVLYSDFAKQLLAYMKLRDPVNS